jgi:hypothetical protein
MNCNISVGWGDGAFGLGQATKSQKYSYRMEMFFLFWSFLWKPQPHRPNRPTSSLLYFYFYKYIDYGLLHNGFGKKNANKKMQTKQFRHTLALDHLRSAVMKSAVARSNAAVVRAIDAFIASCRSQLVAKDNCVVRKTATIDEKSSLAAAPNNSCLSACSGSFRPSGFILIEMGICIGHLTPEHP